MSRRQLPTHGPTILRPVVYLFCVVVLVELITAARCASPPVSSRQAQESYLRRFSYLGQSNPDPNMAALQEDPEKQFQMAIRNFQRFAGVTITGVVDGPTRRMMETPRCGMPDVLNMGNVARRRKRRYTIQGSKWSKTALTYQFLNYSPDLQQSDIRQQFKDAFKMWSDVSALTFTETTGTSADILISFGPYDHGDNQPFDGPGGTLAHAYFPGNEIGGDAHFDDSEKWTYGREDGTNLLQVAVHELGHSLGLGHSDVKSAVMAPFYRGYDPNFRMDQDDIDGITNIYGPKSRRPISTRRPPTYRRPPICDTDTSFDAIEVIDGAIHAFKGDNYWVISDDGFMSSPTRRIQDRWPGVLSNLDAVVSFDMNKGPVFFFKNNYYWRYNKSDSVRPIASRLIRDGFPGIPDNINAAFVWSRNGGLYFIKGSYYYRYRGGNTLESPRLLSAYWPGITTVSAAFQHPDKRTYFYSGQTFWMYNETAYRAGPLQLTNKWLGCSDGRGRMFDEQVENLDSSAAETSPDIHCQLTKFFVQLIFCLLCMVSQSL